jgi:preprotein translocase subunit SecG
MIKLRFFLYTLSFCIVPQILHAGVGNDTLRLLRDKLYMDYQYERSTMKERTWLRLVELDRKALELIEADRLIIEQLTDQTNQEKSGLLEIIDIISLEKALIERETEIQQIALDRKAALQNALVFSTILIAILFFVTLILLITLKKRHRTTRKELERLYSSGDESKNRGIQAHGNHTINNKLNAMKENNEKLKNELNRISDEKTEAIDALKKEIRDRKKMEDEIRNLIEQIKKQ